MAAHGSTVWWGDENTANGGPLSSATRILRDSFAKKKYWSQRLSMMASSHHAITR